MSDDPWKINPKSIELQDEIGNKLSLQFSVGKWHIKCLNKADIGVSVALTEEQFEQLKFWMVCG